jgi:hypothetical protein
MRRASENRPRRPKPGFRCHTRPRRRRPPTESLRSANTKAIPGLRSRIGPGPMRKLIRLGNFASKDMVRTRIEQFIAYFNATMAKPFRWTYAGKPLAG